MVERGWFSIKDGLPQLPGFYFVCIDYDFDHKHIDLGYFNGTRFQDAESAGDKEGLDVEYPDVTHWKIVTYPNFPCKENARSF